MPVPVPIERVPAGHLGQVTADCPYLGKETMAGIHHWSVSLASERSSRPRWLTENGRFSSNPASALRLVSAEVAAKRVQAFMAIRGWPQEAMERFRLVPAPHGELSPDRDVA